ncbi:MAG: hypothetical protein JXR84_09645 [Anaerolineae bacterium]|nr:hypothetical protein [Anaerolineae bacterium]
MSTGSFFMLFFAFIAVMTVGMYGFSKLASKMVTRAIHERLQALEAIVKGEIPDAWLKPFQRRAAALHRNAASEAQSSRLGARIQKRCLRNLDEMTRYVTNVNIADTETTHKTIIADLKAQQQTWLAKEWREWIAHVEALDTLRATEEEQNDFSSVD